MFLVDECKYHAPCGLCTYYNIQCKTMCKSKPKQSSQQKDRVMKEIKEGKGLRPLDKFVY